MPRAVLPLALIYVAVGVDAPTAPVQLVLEQLALVQLARREQHCRVAGRAPVDKGALDLATIDGSQHAVAVVDST